MSTISSGTTLTTALVQVGDTTGDLIIKTGASNTTAMTISGANQSVTINGSLSANGSSITNINAASITVGTIATARLGSGTADNTTFLRGDSTFAVVSSGTLIPTGTVMIFGQTSAPTGFTKLVDQDNAALRVVSGSVVNGGSVNFTTAFASQTPAGSVSIDTSGLSAGATTLSTSQIPSHTHPMLQATGGEGGSFTLLSGQNSSGGVNTGSTGGGGSHTHTVSGSATGSFTGTAINLAVKYVDVIRATKD